MGIGLQIRKNETDRGISDSSIDERGYIDKVGNSLLLELD